ncbi:MAG: STAS domain-containing protein [Gammaproteobacteria bacterium]|nr:STAS domain-containing protein [Gammaproteobacteria bacterium]
MPLEIEIHAEPHEGKRVSLAGSLDTDTANQLQEKIEHEIDSSVHMVIMDLKRLQFLSSAGLRVIFKTKKKMDEHHGKFMLLNLQPQVRKVFDIIKALDGMNVFKSQEEMDEYLTAMQNKVLDGDN